MYNPSYYKVDDYERLVDFIQQHNFGILFSSNNELQATHLPFVVEEEDQIYLEGHFARANNHWRGIDNSEVLVVFSGPHGYISPRYYETNDVPTWNYTTVHAQGTIEICKDDSRRFQIVKKLTNKYESKEKTGWSIDTLSNKDMKNMMKRIVVFRIQIKNLEGKFKLNQNRSDEDIKGVIQGLKSEDQNSKLAKFMEKELF